MNVLRTHRIGHTTSEGPGTAPGLGIAITRRRCMAGAVLAGTGYVATFIIDLWRHTPSDDSIVFGLEIWFAAVGVLCALVAAMAWGMTQSVEFAGSVWALKGRAEARIENRLMSTAPQGQASRER